MKSIINVIHSHKQHAITNQYTLQFNTISILRLLCLTTIQICEMHQFVSVKYIKI